LYSLNNPDNISTIKYIFNINQLKIIYEKFGIVNIKTLNLNQLTI
jgi:hypothetical protein